MKIKTGLIATACLVTCILTGVLGGCANTVSGRVYTLQQAYDNQIIAYKDLLSIAYYKNGGIVYNEELMSEEFVPEPMAPESLSDELNRSIKQTLVDDRNSNNDSVSISLKNIADCRYYGTYNSAIAFSTLYSENGSDFILDTVEHTEVTEGITFYYSSFSNFFDTQSYHFTSGIFIFVEN